MESKKPPLPSKKFILKDASINLGDFLMVSPVLGMIFYTFLQFAHENKLPVVVTSIIDKAPNRISKTHETGRAIDISAKKWDTFHAHGITNKLNDMYSENYGTAPKGKKPRVVVYHDAGTGFHFHLQVKRGIKLFGKSKFTL